MKPCVRYGLLVLPVLVVNGTPVSSLYHLSRVTFNNSIYGKLLYRCWGVRSTMYLPVIVKDFASDTRHTLGKG